jgi:hypothetical protein
LEAGWGVAWTNNMGRKSSWNNENRFEKYLKEYNPEGF